MASSPGLRHVPAVLLLGVILFVSFYRLGSVSLFDVDEAVFAEATREMVQSGDWITPTYNGVNRYDKPILFYWMMALSYKVFGINEFGARFPSALSGLLLSVSVYLFSRRVFDDRTGLYAAAVLVLSPYYFIYSHAAVTDMALTLFITLSLLSFSLYEGGGEPVSARSRRCYKYGFYGFSSLAFLTKGLIGVIFPFGVAALYLLCAKRLRRSAACLFDPGGIAFFLLLSAPWYAAQFLANGSDFFQQFFVKHHFKRYTDVISGHRGPFYYYLAALIAGLFPWIVFLPAGMAKNLRHSKTAAGDSFGLLALVWLCTIVLFFSLSVTKLPNYILPAVPAAAIIISSGMSRAGLRYPKGILAALSAAAGCSLFLSPPYLAKIGIDASWAYWAGGILWFIAGSAAYGMFSGRSAVVPLSAAMLCSLFLISLKVLPLVNRELQGGLYEFSVSAGERLGKDGNLIVFGINKPSIVFYSGHRIDIAGNPEELKRLLGSRTKTLVIAKTSDLEGLAPLGLKLMRKNERYACLEKQ